MRIGLKLPTTGPLATPVFIAEVAQMGDRLGFSSLQVSDHVVMPASIASVYPYEAARAAAFNPEMVYYEPIGTLGFLAGGTHRIRLGTNVLVLPYRHPVVTAKQLATIDALSGGRVFIGVGAGWMEEEFQVLGAPPYAERGAVTDEYIEVFRTLWRDAVPAFEGAYVHFPPLGARPQPAQRPGIPIYVGGNTRPAIRRAVRHGDGWQPLNLTPEELRRALAYLRAQATQAGRSLEDFEVSLNINLRMTAGATERRSGEEDPFLTMVGPASELQDHLNAYAELGVTEIVFGFRTCTTQDEIRESVRLCGEQIVGTVAA